MTIDKSRHSALGTSGSRRNPGSAPVGVILTYVVQLKSNGSSVAIVSETARVSRYCRLIIDYASSARRENASVQFAVADQCAMCLRRM